MPKYIVAIDIYNPLSPDGIYKLLLMAVYNHFNFSHYLQFSDIYIYISNDKNFKDW